MKFINSIKAERNLATFMSQDDPNSDISRKALEKLSKSSTAGIPHIIGVLSGADKHQTVALTEILTSQLDDKTLPCFIDGLRGSNQRTVAGVTWALVNSNTYNPNSLLKFITEDDVSSPAIIEALQAHTRKLNVRELLRRAYELEPREKAAMFKIINEAATEDLVPDLIARASGKDTSARVHLLTVLSRFNRPDVTDTLQKQLKDSNRQVRKAALAGLAKMDSAIDIRQVCELLRDPDIEVQNQAVDLITKIRDPETIKYVAVILKDENEYARRSAVEVLNEIADTSMIKFLLNIIADDDWWVRSRAADALANIGGPKVMQAVLQLIKDDDEDIRRSAIEILNQTKNEEAVGHLIEATTDSDWWVRERAVDALAEIGSQEAVPALTKLLEGEAKSIPVVLRALAKLQATDQIPQILPMLTRPEREIKIEAMRSASALADDSQANSIRTMLEPMMQDQDRTLARAAHDALTAMESRLSPSGIRGGSTGTGTSSTVGAGDTSGAQSGRTMMIDPNEMEQLAATALPAAGNLDITKLKQGDVIDDRYTYIDRIGKGAFGTVILVEDKVVEERLILKFLNANVSSDEEMMKRFVHELRYSRKITHQNVIRIYDFLNIGGNYAISMEYFASHTLGQEISKEPRMSIEQAVSWGVDMATGMEVAHQVGIIHRDLKPANILIDDEGLLKIVDFGVAAAASSGDTQLTKTGYVIGSPKYMAPEQILGKKVDARADIYSIGVILYEMLTGSPPYTKGDHMSVMYQHVQGKAKNCREVNPEIPAELGRVVTRAMEVDKDKRYSSMSELREALAAAC